MKQTKEKSVAIISLLEIPDGLTASCSTCQEVLTHGTYALLYELQHFKFLIGEKEKRMCGCGEEINVPILFDNKASASVMHTKVLSDTEEGKGIPSYPFIEFSQLSHPMLQ